MASPSIFRFSTHWPSALVIGTLLLAGCSRATPSGTIQLPTDEELGIGELGTVCAVAFAVEPRVPAMALAPDLGNLAPSALLEELKESEREILARNGFVIRPSRRNEMYELYESKTEPFVTSDVMFHAWHKLLLESLRGTEEVVLAPALRAAAAVAVRQLAVLRVSLPASAVPDTDAALVHWGTALGLIDPEAALEPELRGLVRVQVERVESADDVGGPPGHPRDDTRFRPQAGYEGPELERYFRASTFLAVTPIRVDSPAGARQAALVALALWSDTEAWEAWLELRRVARLVGGAEEDLGPVEVLRVCRQVYGSTVTPRELGSDRLARKLQQRLAALPRPRITDQPQDALTLNDPETGWGLRVLPPGVTLRARVFQALLEAGRPPSGRHVAALLGSLAPPKAGDSALLEPARRQLEAARAANAGDLDLHTGALAALATLAESVGPGYPAYANAPAWRLKTANTQMGAWSQIEHDACLYSKQTGVWSMLGFREPPPFHGSVEPAPEFFARLAGLVHRTRTAFEELGAFGRIADDARAEAGHRRHTVVVTAEHFHRLEDLLVDATAMAERVLRHEAFSEHQVGVLKNLAETLQYLGFNESNQPSTNRPMSAVVRLHRDYTSPPGAALHVATGRPFEIVVAVPWGDGFSLARGAVYSYFEFWRPLLAGLEDPEWKRLSGAPWLAQEERPWIVGRGVGPAEETWTRDRFEEWLPQSVPEVYLRRTTGLHDRGLSLSSYRHRLDPLGWVRLDARAQEAAGRAFARERLDDATRVALYLWIRDSPPDFRRSVARAGTRTLRQRIAERPDALLFSNNDLLLFLSQRLVEDLQDEELESRFQALKDQRDLVAGR